MTPRRPASPPAAAAMTDLSALDKAGTSGPWHDKGLTLRPGTVYDARDQPLLRAWNTKDAALVAETRNALPLLIEVVRAADALDQRFFDGMEPWGSRDIPAEVDDLSAALAALEAAGFTVEP